MRNFSKEHSNCKMLIFIFPTGGTFPVSILQGIHQVVLNVHLCNVDL